MFRRDVMDAHVDWLRALGCPVMLIGEDSRAWRDAESGETILDPVLSPHALGEPWRQWDWNTVPVGERVDGLSMQARVAVWRYCGVQ